VAVLRQKRVSLQKTRVWGVKVATNGVLGLIWKLKYAFLLGNLQICVGWKAEISATKSVLFYAFRCKVWAIFQPQMGTDETQILTE
jgi:hypothetical protein